MTHSLTCLLCGAPVAESNDDSISDAIIASGNVIFVAGIQYASFEALTRHVFSQMPSHFENHYGACFVQYKSGGSHNFDFTLVVTGEGNDESLSVLQELLCRVQNIYAFGPMTRAETELLTGGSTQLPRRVGRCSSVGIGSDDWAEYLETCMKTALVAMSPVSKL